MKTGKHVMKQYFFFLLFLIAFVSITVRAHFQVKAVFSRVFRWQKVDLSEDILMKIYWIYTWDVNLATIAVKIKGGSLTGFLLS